MSPAPTVGHYVRDMILEKYAITFCDTDMYFTDLYSLELGLMETFADLEFRRHAKSMCCIVRHVTSRHLILSIQRYYPRFRLVDQFLLVELQTLSYRRLSIGNLSRSTLVTDNPKRQFRPAPTPACRRRLYPVTLTLYGAVATSTLEA